MSSTARRKELAAAWEIEQERLAALRARKEALTLYERIEQCEIDEDLKEILHKIASGEREE